MSRVPDAIKKSGVIVIFAAFAVTAGCGSNSSTPQADKPQTESLKGSWEISTTEYGSGNIATLQVNLVSSPCSVSTSIGTFSVQGASCFIADDQTGQGSISGTGGAFIYPPEGLLVGASADPRIGGETVQVHLVFVEADQYGGAAVFDGQGTATDKNMTGTWSCHSGSYVCSGLAGTWSGLQN